MISYHSFSKLILSKPGDVYIYEVPLLSEGAVQSASSVKLWSPSASAGSTAAVHHVEGMAYADAHLLWAQPGRVIGKTSTRVVWQNGDLRIGIFFFAAFSVLDSIWVEHGGTLLLVIWFSQLKKPTTAWSRFVPGIHPGPRIVQTCFDLFLRST